MLLDDFLNGEERWPNGPDGWVFAPLAVCAFMDAWDDHAHCRMQDGEPVVWFCSTENLASIVGAELSRPSIEAAAFDRTESALRFAEQRIVGAGFAGNLKAACRSKAGGGLIELAPAAWGQDDIRELLYSCAIDPERPYDRDAATHWLFFEEQSLWWEVDSTRLGLGLEPIYQRSIESSNPSEAARREDAQQIQEATPSLPEGAKPRDYQYQKYAHQAAKLLREDPSLKRETAFGLVAPDEPMKQPETVRRAIRAAFDLMYDGRGVPHQN